MIHIKTVLFICIFASISLMNAQEDSNKDYIEFNDRKSVVHGVYLGFSASYGEIGKEESGLLGLKLAYVANRKFEVGFSANGFYSQQYLAGLSNTDPKNIIGMYGGLHLEPILFSKSRINLSFPLLLGGGVVGYFSQIDIDEFKDVNIKIEGDTAGFFIIETGISALFNISRFLQLEAGIKYRISSNIDIFPNGENNINGFSIGLGAKFGIFNLGENRYKKQIPNDQ